MQVRLAWLRGDFDGPRQTAEAALGSDAPGASTFSATRLAGEARWPRSPRRSREARRWLGELRRVAAGLTLRARPTTTSWPAGTRSTPATSTPPS